MNAVQKKLIYLKNRISSTSISSLFLNFYIHVLENFYLCINLLLIIDLLISAIYF